MIVDESSDPNFECEACIQAKYAVVPFPKSSSSQNLAVGDVVVCNIWGPASTESIHWHTYYISFTNLGSQLSLLYFLSRRNQSTTSLKNFHRFFITQKGYSFKILHVDNAKEFILGKDFTQIGVVNLWI